MLLTLTLVLAPTLAAQDVDARALFVTHCAACHGVEGDGRGTTQLDRPARSFADGGFSFGNTPEALFRTITSGIPGTPMPGFESALSADERRGVAAFVRSLGPEPVALETSGALLAVTDRPRVVRGKLPALVEGGDELPRGLLLGTTGGLSFEYRTDDVRLLAVRLGEFVLRRDWSGRGGDALEPLGRPVFLVHGGAPRATFARPGAGALTARLTGSFARPGSVAPGAPELPGRGELGLSYRLVDDSGTTVARVDERVDGLSTSVGSGFVRRFHLRAGDAPVQLLAYVVNAPPGAPLGDGSSLAFPMQGGLFRVVRFEGDGLLSPDVVRLRLGAGEEARFAIGIVDTLDFSSETQRLLHIEGGLR